jgi:serine/threonine-protein kinase
LAEVVDMESEPGTGSASEAVEAPVIRRRTGVPTSGLGAQHQARRYATVVPSESFDVPFKPGEVLAGKYRILQLLGVGGVGFVMSAVHLGLDSTVALKFLKPEFLSNQEALRSFKLEAGASFKINSEHVVRVHDVDALANGMPFMVMELLNGRDLRQLLQHQRVLPAGLAVDIALQCCEALAAAHAMQIVHRDVKPENLFIIGSADVAYVKMLDFGIARVSAATSSMGGVTPSMVAVGTPPYMSPEQIRGSRNLDARTDQWSLGCVLYEALTGISPFARPSIMQSCAAVLEEEPASLRAARPELPEELERVVMRCLKKSAGDRYRDIAELACALAPHGKHYAYADRCKSLLTERPSHVTAASIRRAEAPSALQPTMTSVRTSTSASGPVRRLPTGAIPAEPSRVNRPATVNPLLSPVPTRTNLSPRAETRPPQPRQASSLAVATPAVAAAAAAAEFGLETTDVGVIPGLRPGRTRLILVIVAATSIAIALAYSMS